MTTPTIWYCGLTNSINDDVLADTLASLTHPARGTAALAVSRRIEIVVEGVRRWLTGEDPRRQQLVTRAPSPRVFSRGLDTTLVTWSSPGQLSAWLHRDIGGVDSHLLPLEAWQAAAGGFRRCFSPRLLLHIQSGPVGAPSLEGLVAAVLVGAPVLLKVASGEPGLVEAFCATLVEIEPSLAPSLAVARWPGGTSSWEALALAEAEVVLFQGGDDTWASLAPHIPPSARVVCHPHRFSFAYVARDVHLTPEVFAALALDVGSYDQSGCLSPQLLYCEGDLARAEQVGEGLARAFAELHHTLPPAPLSLEQRAAIVQLKGRLAFTGKVWAGEGWTLALEESPPLSSPGGRTLSMAPVLDLPAALHHLGPLVRRVQGVSLAAGDSFGSLADTLAGAGVSVITRPGELQAPPTGWPADGRLLLSDLVRWVWRSA